MILPSLPDYRNTIVKINGINKDIVSTLNDNFKKAKHQMDGIKFSGGPSDKALGIWAYIRNHVKYVKDASGKQVIQLPARMFNDTKQGDCKSMALAAAALMANNGFNNVRLRYTSYEQHDKTPTHVYAVGDFGGVEFIVDPVYNRFNRELPYKHKKDYKMEISVLSGVPMVKRQAGALVKIKKPIDLKVLLTKVKPGGLFFTVISNKLGRDSGKVDFMRYDKSQLAKYRNQLQKQLVVKNPTLRQLVMDEIYAINNASFIGNVWVPYGKSIAGINEEIGRISLKKIGKAFKKAGQDIKKVAKKLDPKILLKGLKAVGLVVPRKAFLAVVALNVRGLASRLASIPQDKLRKVWVDRLGGQMSVLNSAINNGKRKSPLIGGSNKRVRAIRGIGYVMDESDDYIGVSPASGADAAGGAGGGSPVNIGALIQVAGPIIELVMKLLTSLGSKEPKEVTESGEDGSFSEVSGSGGQTKFEEYFNKGLDIAENLGIIPERNLSAQEQQVDNALPGDDHSDMADDTGFTLTPALGLGLLAGAYLLFKK